MADLNFGLLDTQMPGRFAAIPQQQEAQQAQNALQLMQLQHSVGQNELAKYQLSSAKRADTEAEQLRALYGGASAAGMTDPEFIRRVYAVNPTQGMALEKALAERATAGLTQKNLTSQMNARDLESQYKAAEHAKENFSFLRAIPGGATDADIDAVVKDAAKSLGMQSAFKLGEELKKLSPADRNLAFDSLGLKADKRLELLSPKLTVIGGQAYQSNFNAPGFMTPFTNVPTIPQSAVGRAGADLAAATARGAPPEEIAALTAAVNAPRLGQETAQGQLTVARRNAATSEARLKLAQEAPKLGLTDPEDIDRVAVAVANNRLPVDKLNSTTAPMFAKLLKANPDLDFTKTSIDQAVARTGAVTTARIGAEQTRTTSLTPEMIQQHGDAYNTNGKLPSLGSGPQAAVDRVAILRYASENNPTDATTKALNKAQLDALVPLAKRETDVTSYVKTFDKNIELARAALTKVSNTNIPALNAWLLNPAQRQLTGDPDLKALGVYVSSLQAEFAKIQSGAMGNSVIADAAIKRAQDTINTADSPRAFRAALDAMVKESRNRIDSFEDTRKEMAAKVRGQPAPTTPAAATPAPGWGKAEAK